MEIYTDIPVNITVPVALPRNDVTLRELKEQKKKLKARLNELDEQQHSEELQLERYLFFHRAIN